MEQVVERGNMWAAHERVLRNKGEPGPDGLRVQDLKAWLQAHWPAVKAALLRGSYLPREVRAVDLPKPDGGVRTLGVPSVVDRLFQQALLQILQPIFDPGFSESSYGFRPARTVVWEAGGGDPASYHVFGWRHAMEPTMCCSVQTQVHAVLRVGWFRGLRMTKTHRIKFDPFRHILSPRDEVPLGTPLRSGLQFPHDERFHERLAHALQRTWWLADPEASPPPS